MQSNYGYACMKREEPINESSNESGNQIDQEWYVNKSPLITDR